MNFIDGSKTLARVLEKTVSLDHTELKNADKYLKDALQSNTPEFVRSLSDVLSNPEFTPVARMAAGLQLKNSLTSKDQQLKLSYQQRWLSYPEDVKDYIKTNVLKTLGTESNRPSSAAQCVAFIAVIELPLRRWPDCMSILCSNIISDGSTVPLQEASLESLGYICQDIDSECLLPFSDNILTAIVHGMKESEANYQVGLSATTALLNSLEFTRANFEKEMERNYIMEVVCKNTQSTHTQIRVVALQCLVKIMSLYYDYMNQYMAKALFAITTDAMKSEVNEVALQGIEFWSNICDEELNLTIEENEAAQMGEPIPSTSCNYAKSGLPLLVPTLMERLTKQDENDDEDEWNPCKAASVCLLLLVSCCEQDVIPHIMPFVEKNIKNPDWRYRDASLMAFSAMLRLDDYVLKDMVDSAILTVIDLMGDPSIVVRDTAAWTVGQICENVPQSATELVFLEPLLRAMVNGLKDEPRVASNVCWAFVELAKSSFQLQQDACDNGVIPETYRLSKYFDDLIKSLLEVTKRSDGNQAKLRLAAYEALMEFVRNSPKDCYTTVQNTMLVILDTLNQVLRLERQPQTTATRAEMIELQGMLCATLQSVLAKITKEDAPKISDSTMTALLEIFVSNPAQGSGVQEEALRAISALIEVTGSAFIRYMESFRPYLLTALKNYQEYQICSAAVGVVADLCTELKKEILPYSDSIMDILLQNLSNTSVDRSIKPQMLSALGDMALAIEFNYQKYLDFVLPTLMQASQIEVDKTNFDMLDYLNEIRESVLNAYSSILQVLPVDNSWPFFEMHVPYILTFIESVAGDDDLSDETVSACLALIGDLLSIYGSLVARKFDPNVLNKVIATARRSDYAKTRNYGSWVTREMKKYLGNW